MSKLKKFPRRKMLPGFGLTMGFTLLYLSLIILIPLAGVFFKAFDQSWTDLWNIIVSPRAMASYRLTFGTSLIAAIINAIFGVIIAWVLVRYRFPGKRFIDALVDLPFALPTAVAGIALTSLYAPTGWIGHYFNETSLIGSLFPPDGIRLAYNAVGVTVQPVLEDLSHEIEEAAASLGANRWQTITRIILPELRPAILTGFALALARAIGEYGSVIFIAGNMPNKTEITPLLIIIQLEQFNYAGAAAIACVMLIISFFLLLTINLIQWRASRFQLSVR
jgi:sulfate transport system permease protein